MVTFRTKGSFLKTKILLERAKNESFRKILDKYGVQGVSALAMATPFDTGETASSWGYEVVHGNGRSIIYWTNSNVNDGVPIAVVLQYGHAARNGGFVEGVDYINPAIKPIFEDIAKAAWEEVTK